MSTFIVLPTQLFNQPKSFWNQWKEVIVYEDPYYINKSVHPMKLWFHRASMMEYYDKIPNHKKRYIQYQRFESFKDYTLYHPTDAVVVSKYKSGTILDSPMFILKINELAEMDTSVQDAFYKRMRKKYNILMNGDKPQGGKW